MYKLNLKKLLLQKLLHLLLILYILNKTIQYLTIVYSMSNFNTGNTMILENQIPFKTKQLLLELRRSNVDKQRALVKGSYYADEIIRIRHMSKSKLVEYIAETKAKPGVKLALKIAHSNSTKVYRMLDNKVKQDMELINYARNRLYATV